MAGESDKSAQPKGFRYVPGALGTGEQRVLLQHIQEIVAEAPFYTPTMPRSGRPLSVRMSNCGPLGWLSDKEGYRYVPRHPETDRPWPGLPKELVELWSRFAPDAAPPEACLINFYGPNAKLGLHVDADEDDRTCPVVSISLGDDAWFRIGGLSRRDPTGRIRLRSGDVVILGGEARNAYHGVDRVLPGTSRLLGEPGRINLTMRRVTPVR